MSGRRMTAFVTGAAGGLGAAIANHLFAWGHNVALADSNAAVFAVATALDPTATTAIACQLDIRDEAAFSAAFEEAGTRFGAIDIMVNNAARTAMDSVWNITAAEWDDVLSVNLRGTFFGCRIAGRHMKERRNGRIINLSSIAGQQASPATGAHYAASKAGILALTKTFAMELAPYSVTVNAIAPSAIASPAVETASPETIAKVVGTIPLRRLGTMDEVSGAVIYLASPAAAYITGATLDINGGRLMR